MGEVAARRRTGSMRGGLPGMRELRLAVLLSGGGHVVHNVQEFGFSVLAVGQSLLPAVVTIVLYLGARHPTPRYLQALLGWSLVVVVGGGGSVLPLPLLPFTPAQTVDHYLAHFAYALLQVPALVLAARGLRIRRRK